MMTIVVVVNQGCVYPEEYFKNVVGVQRRGKHNWCVAEGWLAGWLARQPFEGEAVRSK